LIIHLDLIASHPFPWMMPSGMISWHEPSEVNRILMGSRDQAGPCTLSCTESVDAMDAISYTAARANLAQTMKRVCADHEPMIITRNGEPSVVMVSLDDFKALEETAYLLRTPTNARRLMDAIDSLNAGGGEEHDLPE
jgi:antitoxin YefM